MDQVPDRGACIPEDINKIEEQAKSYSFIGGCDTGHGISTQSIAMLSVNSVEGGPGLVNCNVNIRLAPKNDDKSFVTYERRKRQRKTELSDIPSSNLGFLRQDTNLGSSSLDRPFGFEFASQCSSESISEKRVIAEDGISLEVDEKKSLEECGTCSLDFQKTSSSNYGEAVIGESDDSIENQNVDMLANNHLKEFHDEAKEPVSIVEVHDLKFEVENVGASDVDLSSKLLDASKGVGSQVAHGESINILVDRTLASYTEECGTCSLDFQKTSSSNYGEVVIGESDDSIENQNVDMLANNHLKEFHDEAKEPVSIVEVHDLKFEVENVGASDVDLSSKLLDASKGVGSQVAHSESINIPVDRTLASYTGKKLLVLDVNGLLVDISSYIPYDYEPDDIILKKAVFKRPHCDDFLKFCFERFNVGVWTSRTKSNVEPILDLLLGSDKRKLLFCWDQSQCTNTGFTTVEKRHKPLLLKKLKKLWNKSDPDLPWERGVFNESNTLLIDDTPYKALSNPRYTAVFPYSYRFRDVNDNSLGRGGDLRVYLEGLASAENVQEYVKQNPFGQRQITEKNLSWGYYRKVIEASSTPPRQTDGSILETV